MCVGRENTAVPGVERAPKPSRVSRVRNMETPSWSGAPKRAGKPIVRGAEPLDGKGCPRRCDTKSQTVSGSTKVEVE